GERSAREKEVLGFYFSEHPIEQVASVVERLRTHSVAELLEQEDGAEVRAAGLIAETRVLTTRSGKRMAIAWLRDLSGRIECTIFPDTWEKSREAIAPDHVVVMAGRIEVREDRGIKLLASEVRGLEEAEALYRPSLHLEIRAEELTESWLVEVDQL